MKVTLHITQYLITDWKAEELSIRKEKHTHKILNKTETSRGIIRILSEQNRAICFGIEFASFYFVSLSPSVPIKDGSSGKEVSTTRARQKSN